MNRRNFLLTIPFVAVASKVKSEPETIVIKGLQGPVGNTGVPGPSGIQFINGELTIDIEQEWELYRTLELHKMNAANKFNGNPLFKSI